MLAYFLTFLAIPSSANLNETEELAFIDPNRFLVIVLNLEFDLLFQIPDHIHCISSGLF